MVLEIALSHIIFPADRAFHFFLIAREKTRIEDHSGIRQQGLQLGSGVRVAGDMVVILCGGGMVSRGYVLGVVFGAG